jgi:hypothetical protein
MARRQYTDTQIGEALHCFALASGNGKRCQALLDSRKLKMAVDTVRTWACHAKPELYAKIQNSVEEQVWTELGDVQRELAHENAELEREVTAKIREKLGEVNLDGRELANLHKSTAYAAGLHTKDAGEARAPLPRPRSFRSSSMPAMASARTTPR